MKYGKRAALTTFIGAIAGLGAAAATPASAQDRELTFAVIRHAQPGDTFWDIIRKDVAAAARERGIGVIFITHNPHHADMVGDHLIALARGTVETDAPRSRLSLEDLMFQTDGGAPSPLLIPSRPEGPCRRTLAPSARERAAAAPFDTGPADPAQDEGGGRTKVGTGRRWHHMAGGAGLQALQHELHVDRAPGPSAVGAAS